MRKVRDYDAELKALNDKARGLKAKKIQQLGELVAATGADTFDAETLAGVLLAAIESDNADRKEAWRTRGAAFFQGRARKGSKRAGGNAAGTGPDDAGNPAN
jgi:hypothetical protein